MRRVVVESPFSPKKIVSFGLIVRAEDTGRWLIVQRRDSSEFITLLSGSYRETFLHILLSMITREEGEELKKCRDLTYFDRTYSEKVGVDLEYARKRMEEEIEEIVSHLERMDLSSNTLEWTWPKGRPVPSESPFQCAYREFVEETGIELPPPTYTSRDLIRQNLFTSTGKNLESRYMIYFIEREIPLTEPIDNLEVGDRRWCSDEEVSALINHRDLFDYVLSKVTDRPVV